MRSYKAARREHLREPVEFDLTYCTVDAAGVEEEVTDHFVCRGDISAITLSDFAHQADVSADTPEGGAILRRVFAEAFGVSYVGDSDVPVENEQMAEFRRFQKVMARHFDDDDMVEVLSGLIEDFSGRPTKRLSDSPSSPVSSGPTSRVVSLPGGFSTQAEPASSSA